MKVEIISRPIQIGGHECNGIEPVLTPVSLAHLQARYLGNGIPLVGRLQRAGQQIVFFDGLRCQLGVYAAGAQEDEFVDSSPVGRIDHIVLHEQVVPDEFRRPGIVGVDAAHPRGRHDDCIGALAIEERADGSLVREVQLPVGEHHLIPVALPL